MNECSALNIRPLYNSVVQEEGQEDVKSQRVRKKAAHCYLLGRTRPLHARTHSCEGCPALNLHKNGSTRSQAWMEEGLWHCLHLGAQ